MVYLGPFWARLGLVCVRRSEMEDWQYLGLNGPNHDSKSSFSLSQPPLPVVFARLGAHLPSPIVEVFGSCVPQPTMSPKSGPEPAKLAVSPPPHAVFPCPCTSQQICQALWHWNPCATQPGVCCFSHWGTCDSCSRPVHCHLVAYFPVP